MWKSWMSGSRNSKRRGRIFESFHILIRWGCKRHGSNMGYIKYGFIVAIVVVVGVLILLGPKKQSTSIIPTETITVHISEGDRNITFSGTAPLGVTFVANLSTGETYAIDFGDDASAQEIKQSCSNRDCPVSSHSINHLYIKKGTYQAALLGGNLCGIIPSQTGTTCPSFPITIVGSVTIIVR